MGKGSGPSVLGAKNRAAKKALNNTAFLDLLPAKVLDSLKSKEAHMITNPVSAKTEDTKLIS